VNLAMNSTALAGYDAMFVTDAVGGRSHTAHRTGIEMLAHAGVTSRAGPASGVGVAQAEKFAAQGQEAQ
jgi:hypothetical protein